MKPKFNPNNPNHYQAYTLAKGSKLPKPDLPRSLILKEDGVLFVPGLKGDPSKGYMPKSQQDLITKNGVGYAEAMFDDNGVERKVAVVWALPPKDFLAVNKDTTKKCLDKWLKQEGLTYKLKEVQYYDDHYCNLGWFGQWEE